MVAVKQIQRGFGYGKGNLLKGCASAFLRGGFPLDRMVELLQLLLQVILTTNGTNLKKRRMNSLFHFCQGESHKSTEKPCQDCAYAESTDSLSMAIVSDGHGGERYFRSQFGSRFAVEITKEAIRHFVTSMAESSLVRQGEKSVFAEKEFTSFSTETATDIQIDSKAHQALMWLFSSIINYNK